jgi:hypothetical protein
LSKNTTLEDIEDSKYATLEVWVRSNC